MRRTVLFVQGAGQDAHEAWDDKLVASLQRALGEDYAVRYPHMPDEADPHYALWKTALRREFQELEDGDILVGHSIGGAILLHSLAEAPPPFRPGGLFLLAIPFIGEGGWPSEEIPPRATFSESLPAPIHLYHGTDDDTVPFAHTRLYTKALPQAVIIAVPLGDHQFHNDLSAVAADIRALAKG